MLRYNRIVPRGKAAHLPKAEHLPKVLHNNPIHSGNRPRQRRMRRRNSKGSPQHRLLRRPMLRHHSRDQQQGKPACRLARRSRVAHRRQ